MDIDHQPQGETSGDTLADLSCPDCGYSLQGLTARTCPECGRAFDPHWLRLIQQERHSVLRTTGFRTAAIVGALFLIMTASIGISTYPRWVV